MNEELTLGDMYEEIAEKLAQARTKALMGEREEALGLLQGAVLEMTRFRDLLSGYPGFLALDHSLQATLIALCAEHSDTATASGSVTRPIGKVRLDRRAGRAA